MNYREHQQSIDDGWIDTGKLLIEIYKKQGEAFLLDLPGNVVNSGILSEVYRVLRNRKTIPDIDRLPENELFTLLEDATTITGNSDRKHLLKLAKAIQALNGLISSDN